MSSYVTLICASCHNGVSFLDITSGKKRHNSHLTGWLRTRRFSERTFRPPRATNHWGKKSRLSYLLTHLHLLSSYYFSFALPSSNPSSLCLSPALLQPQPLAFLQLLILLPAPLLILRYYYFHFSQENKIPFPCHHHNIAPTTIAADAATSDVLLHAPLPFSNVLPSLFITDHYHRFPTCRPNFCLPPPTNTYHPFLLVGDTCRYY